MTASDFGRTAREFYDTVAADYAAYFKKDLADKPLERALIAGFAELVRMSPGRPEAAGAESGGDSGVGRVGGERGGGGGGVGGVGGVGGGGVGPVADVGCGPGRLTARLNSLGLSAYGIDLSPGMLAVARSEHPGLRFEEGSMLALDLPDCALGALVARYSIIHLPLDRLPDALAEFHRVVAPCGEVLVAFQVGDEPLRLEQPFDHPVSLDFHRRRPDHVADLLARAGFVVHTRMEREPDEAAGESTPQAFLIAHKPRHREPRSP